MTVTVSSVVNGSNVTAGGVVVSGWVVKVVGVTEVLVKVVTAGGVVVSG